MPCAAAADVLAARHAVVARVARSARPARSDTPARRGRGRGAFHSAVRRRRRDLRSLLNCAGGEGADGVEARPRPLKGRQRARPSLTGSSSTSRQSTVRVRAGRSSPSAGTSAPRAPTERVLRDRVLRWRRRRAKTPRALLTRRRRSMPTARTAGLRATTAPGAIALRRALTSSRRTGRRLDRRRPPRSTRRPSAGSSRRRRRRAQLGAVAAAAPRAAQRAALALLAQRARMKTATAASSFARVEVADDDARRSPSSTWHLDELAALVSKRVIVPTTSTACGNAEVRGLSRPTAAARDRRPPGDDCPDGRQRARHCSTVGASRRSRLEWRAMPVREARIVGSARRGGLRARETPSSRPCARRSCDALLAAAAARTTAADDEARGARAGQSARRRVAMSRPRRCRRRRRPRQCRRSARSAASPVHAPLRVVAVGPSPAPRGGGRRPRAATPPPPGSPPPPPRTPRRRGSSGRRRAAARTRRSTRRRTDDDAAGTARINNVVDGADVSQLAECKPEVVEACVRNLQRVLRVLGAACKEDLSAGSTPRMKMPPGSRRRPPTPPRYLRRAPARRTATTPMPQTRRATRDERRRGKGGAESSAHAPATPVKNNEIGILTPRATASSWSSVVAAASKSRVLRGLPELY